MTFQIFLFENPDRFIVGTVGQPGERTFFIQAEQGNRLVSVSLEKSQIQALAERIAYMLKEIKKSDPTIMIERVDKDDKPLATPIEEEFRVGVIGLAFDAQVQKLQIDLQAISDTDSEQQELFEISALDAQQDLLRVLVTPGVAQAFSRRALNVVGAGRQPCPFCGGPIDLRGHLCPRANGYRR